ncbi:MAG: hypothetical protein HYW89_02470 [Candidatus Sungiibacteriota bacterium]|uniref:CMP/dCMP-type deaminase domain-containing protein n=1 Tax=Candidatus Sungiibacteriota bacterium TaxID=2750080 RepID=A0A7T5RKE9_9BACT|nr:MAG: hypothetical protein HYW89_02470 [Candidatus Sungbacteria bacterium]
MSEKFFEMARQRSQDSTCLKTKTGVVIIKNGQKVSSGCNLCAPEGHIHGDVVSDCPRMSTKTGTGYELCKPIHAEVMACLNIRPNRTPKELAQFASHINPAREAILRAFTPDERKRLAGATLYLVGHYWACEGCRKFAEAVGITDIQFDELTGKETEDRYKATKIT